MNAGPYKVDLTGKVSQSLACSSKTKNKEVERVWGKVR